MQRQSVIEVMSIYTHKFVLPKLIHQMDIETVENAVMMSPSCHNVEADSIHHSLIVQYVDRDSLEDIEKILIEAGFPPLKSKVHH